MGSDQGCNWSFFFSNNNVDLHSLDHWDHSFPDRDFD